MIFDNYEENYKVAIQLTKKRGGQSEEDLVATATVNTSIGIKQDFVAIKDGLKIRALERC